MDSQLALDDLCDHHRRLVQIVILALIAANILALVAQLNVGEYSLPLSYIMKTFLQPADGDDAFVLLTLRLPRALVAFLVGVGLAISGAIIQSITRNSLASSGTLGINAGASLAAILMIVALPHISAFYLPMAAFGGGLSAAIVTYMFGWAGTASPARMILVGIGVGAFCSAVMTIMMVLGEIHLVSQATIWISGSVYARSWEELAPLSIWLGILLPMALILCRLMDVLQLGREISTGLGSRVERDGLILILLSVGIASACVATAGAVGFVGLMSPHIARRILGSNHHILLPVSGLVGGLIVQLSDIAGRVVFAPYEIPCGVVTAAIGGPFMIYLLIKK